MRTPSAAELLAVWEEGITQHPVERAVLLLALARTDLPVQALAEVSLGERDALLLALRERLFGTRLHSLALCPACGERLELAFDVNDIRVPPPAPRQLTGEVSIASGDYFVRCRLPSSADLLAIADCQEANAAQQKLLARCVVSVERTPGEADASQASPSSSSSSSSAFTVEELPRGVVEAVVEGMQQADPQADIQLSLNCAVCGRGWLMAFDIASYLWEELTDWAERTLREVHALATAYGWREADILAMSARRRQTYLEMLGA
jgi:hypothetical protein